MKKSIVIPAIFFAAAVFTSARAQKDFHILKTFHIQSAGGWDYIAVGPGNNRLYVSHGTQVNILDKTTGDSTGVIENTTGVHGIAFDITQNKGFTSNGRLNNVTVFDLKTNAVITQIPTGSNPDAIMYEPWSKKIITCNGRSKNLSIIDPVSNNLIDSIAVGGKPETAVSNGDGIVYVNIEDKNEIVVVNMKTLKAEIHWPIPPGEEPTGLAYDKSTNRLFAGCGNKYLMVINASNGVIVDKLSIGDGCDGVAFDIFTKNIFASNGEGTLAVYHEKSANEFEKVTTVTTKRGARTIVVDEQTHLIYLPTADFENPDPNTPNARPKMIPGTFQVLVIGQ
ncbi:MAG: YncE family protein [Chitinophagaceae bacterium]|nr:MAG: YncE family protein [Chitinophagaceae bacterium]